MARHRFRLWSVPACGDAGAARRQGNRHAVNAQTRAAYGDRLLPSAARRGLDPAANSPDSYILLPIRRRHARARLAAGRGQRTLSNRFWRWAVRELPVSARVLSGLTQE